MTAAASGTESHDFCPGKENPDSEGGGGRAWGHPVEGRSGTKQFRPAVVGRYVT